MTLEIKQHIELHGDNPLAAVMIGTNKKAYLVASLALNDGVEAAAEQDELTLADVHAALAFYHENEATIQSALEVAREQIRVQGGFDRLEEIRRRKQSE
jgi:hypothetical protein